MLCQHGRGVVCLECHDTIRRLCVDLNKSQAENARLRAELAESRAKLARLQPTNDICSAREAARRRMRLDGADAQALEHALTITERERDAALRELDARPEISREDAAGYVQYDADPESGDPSALYRVRKAIRAHAASAASEARLRELKRQLSEAGDRHDRDDCDRIEAEIERIEKGEASGYANARTCVAGARTCRECNGTGRKGER